MNRKLNNSQIPAVALAATAAAASLFLSGTPVHAQQSGGTNAGGAAARSGRLNRNGSTLPQSGGVNGTGSTSGGSGRTRGAASGSGTGSASSFRVSAGSIPGAVEPIMNRAATLLRVAEARQNSAPGGAKESYRASAQALRQLLKSGHLAPGMGSGSGLLSAPSVSSTQVADDIRTLRASAKSSRGAQMTMLNNAASLYATGTKEYFTGQLREALFDANVTAAPVVIRGTRSGSGSQAAQTGTRQRRPPSNQQGGVIINPPLPGQQNNGVGNNGSPTFGDPLTVPGTTVIAPGGGVVVPGTVTAPVVVPAPNAPVTPDPVTPPAAPPATNP